MNPSCYSKAHKNITLILCNHFSAFIGKEPLSFLIPVICWSPLFFPGPCWILLALVDWIIQEIFFRDLWYIRTGGTISPVSHRFRILDISKIHPDHSDSPHPTFLIQIFTTPPDLQLTGSILSGESTMSITSRMGYNQYYERSTLIFSLP